MVSQIEQLRKGTMITAHAGETEDGVFESDLANEIEDWEEPDDMDAFPGVPDWDQEDAVRATGVLVRQD